MRKTTDFRNVLKRPSSVRGATSQKFHGPTAYFTGSSSVSLPIPCRILIWRMQGRIWLGSSKCSRCHFTRSGNLRMNFLDTISDVWSLSGDDPCRRRPARRQWRGGHDHGAITLDENGFVVDMNAAAQAILDDNVKIRDRRIVLRDAKSRG